MKKVFILSVSVLFLFSLFTGCELFVDPFEEEAVVLTETDILRNYLADNFSTCQTSIGPTNFEFSVSMNTSYQYPYDYWVKVDYDTSWFYNLKYEYTITTEMNHLVCEELKEFQYQIALAAIAHSPDKKILGSYLHSGYLYPNIYEGYYSYRYYSWLNYSPESFLTEYHDAVVADFVWTPLYDDILPRE